MQIIKISFLPPLFAKRRWKQRPFLQLLRVSLLPAAQQQHEQGSFTPVAMALTTWAKSHLNTASSAVFYLTTVMQLFRVTYLYLK